MSSQSLRRHHRRCLDAAIRRAFASLVTFEERDAFARLRWLVRARSDLMEAAPAIVDGAPRFPQVDALRNLARWSGELVAAHLHRWPGAHGHPLRVIHALAGHALGRYPTPRFLASVWFDDDRAHQGWFVAHARGTRVRSLPLPIALTRRMEHVFLALPDDSQVLPALRRAEVLGLGGDRALADAVVATRLGRCFARGDFWRSALVWMVARAGDLDPAQVGAIVDYLDEVRHGGDAVDTPAGPVVRAPIDPSLSLRGRSVASLLRDIAAWRLARGLRAARGLTWAPAPWREYRYEEPAADRRVCWRVIELCDSDALAAEGHAMRHCVATYRGLCRRGWSSIWSVRRRIEHAGDPGAEHPVLTVEVDPLRARIVQVRGFANKRAGGAGLEVVRAWAARERLTL